MSQYGYLLTAIDRTKAARCRRAICTRFVFFAALFLSSGAFTDNADARSLQQVLNSGEIRIGVALATPWVIRDKDNNLAGYEIDIGRTLAADLDVEPRFIVYSWDELLKAIEAAEVDLIVAGLTISPARALRVNFSNPHTTGGLKLATRLASTREVASLADLDNPDFSLAVVDNSIAASLASRLLPRMNLRTFPSAAAAGDALVDGSVDAYLEEEPAPTFLALENPTRIDVPLVRPLLETHAGFAIAKGDADFITFLNAWIVAREADTWLPTTHAYWFGSLRWRDRLGSALEF